MDQAQTQQPTPRHWRPVPRWLRLGLWTLLAVYGAYLLLGNIYLNSPLGPLSVNRKPEKFTMHWGPALTWWPGEVVLWKVSMRGHVSQTVWSLQADRAAGHIAVTALLRKELYIPRLRVDEVTGDVQRVEGEIPPPPVRPGGWLLNFPAITSDSVHGGRVHGLVLEGQGRAKVGFTKRLRGGPAELLESNVVFQKMRLTMAGTALLQKAALEAQFAMSPVSRAQAKGVQKLRYMRLALKLDADTPGLGATQGDAGQLALKLQPGKGHVQGSLAMSNAVLRPGGVLSWRMPVVITDPQGKAQNSTLAAQVSVHKDVHLKADMPAQGDGLLALNADLKVEGTQVPLGEFDGLLPRTSGRVAGQWQFSSLQWITSLFVNVPWLSLEGSGQVAGDITLNHGVLAPGSRLDVPHVQAQADVLGQRVTGRASAKARLEADSAGKPRSIVDVAMSEYSVAALDELRRPYIRGNDLKLHTESDPDLSKARESLLGHATFNDARVPDLRAYNRFLPNNHMRFDGGSGSLSGNLALNAAGNAASGRVHITAHKAKVHAAGIAMRSDVKVDLKLKRADLERQQFEVDGSVLALNNVSFAQQGNSRSGWWAQLELRRAQLDVADQRLSVQGAVATKMKDVGFLLDLFSQDQDYPKWMVKLVDQGTAQATAKVRWRDGDLVLDDINASNDRLDLLGRFQLRDEAKPQGDLYARWGVLGAAVQLRGGQHKFHLLGAKRWYDAQLPYLE